MSTETAFTKTLVPANGVLVIDPATSRALSAKGDVVRGNPEYWLRRLRDGDVTEFSAATATQPSSKQEGSKS